MPIVGKLGFDKVLFSKIAAGRAKYMAYSKAQLTERTKLGDETDRRDFFYYLLRARDPETGVGFTTPELWGRVQLAAIQLTRATSIIAGSDTTSTAMAATFFYLVRNAAALQKATAEVRGVFSDVEEITQGAGLNSCTYLRACVDEAMRMSPSVLLGGITIDGEHIPEGTVVGTPHYTIHHNGSYYPDPFTYTPERWITGSHKSQDGERVITASEVEVAQSAFCPFSIGPRGCIGKGLAYQEMMTTLARTLYLYDIRKAPGVVDPGEGNPRNEYGRHRVQEFQLIDQFTSLKDGPIIEFRKRV
ncbi:hypothetical protein PG997_013006 [Apiospora hydei]|uniref:Uncharacterized protein n=1 Tax=Apiospora hydei TaxID=1337664 RepID=A0ABR1V866_9PEZI